MFRQTDGVADFVEFTFVDGTAVALQVFPSLPSPHGDAPDDERRDGGGQDEEPYGSASDDVPGFGQSRPAARRRPWARASGATAGDGAMRTMLAPLVPLLQHVHDTVAAVPDTPDELSVCFGVRVSQDLRIGIVGATGEATMTVTANWTLCSPGAPAAESGAPEAGPPVVAVPDQGGHGG